MPRCGKDLSGDILKDLLEKPPKAPFGVGLLRGGKETMSKIAQTGSGPRLGLARTARAEP